jgi:hypothetical protein
VPVRRALVHPPPCTGRATGRSYAAAPGRVLAPGRASSTSSLDSWLAHGRPFSSATAGRHDRPPVRRFSPPRVPQPSIPPLSCGQARPPCGRVRRQDRVADCPDAAVVQVRRAALDTRGVMPAAPPSRRWSPSAPSSVPRRHAALHGRARRCAPRPPGPRSPTAAPVTPTDRRHELRAPGSPERPAAGHRLACAEAETTDGASIVLGY